jgi:dTDP-4-amino-4,6-dideoxygalactose transaminase
VRVPLLDLQAQHAAIAGEIQDAFAQVLAHGRFVGGPEVATFEGEFAAWCGAEECIGVASGTDALTVGLRAAGIGPGDEVITTPMTFIATIESIVEAGATPVFVDCDPDTGLLNADAVAAALTPRTAAVAPVHLWGQTVDLDAFEELCNRHGLLFAEDAAQAHGASWGARRAGSVGGVAAFSFFPGKNLGALGDAGAITAPSGEVTDRARRLRDHGRVDKYRHDLLATNARLDTLQAAILSVKLRHLDAWTSARQAQAAAYDAAFAEIDGIDPIRVEPQATSVYHQYVVRVGDRDGAGARLAEHGIASGVHYPIPLHRQPALAAQFGGDAYPAAERLSETVLSLPISPELEASDRDRIVELLAAHARTAGAVAR